MKTVYRAVLEVVGAGGQKVLYESHDCATLREAQARATFMGADAFAVKIDFDEASGATMNREKA